MIGSYRWVQTIVSFVRIGDSVQVEVLTGTTVNASPEFGLDDLIYRHASQVQSRGGEIISTSITAMGADGKMITIRALGAD